MSKRLPYIFLSKSNREKSDFFNTYTIDELHTDDSPHSISKLIKGSMEKININGKVVKVLDITRTCTLADVNIPDTLLEEDYCRYSGVTYGYDYKVKYNIEDFNRNIIATREDDVLTLPRLTNRNSLIVKGTNNTYVTTLTRNSDIYTDLDYDKFSQKNNVKYELKANNIHGTYCKITVSSMTNNRVYISLTSFKDDGSVSTRVVIGEQIERVFGIDLGDIQKTEKDYINDEDIFKFIKDFILLDNHKKPLIEHIDEDKYEDIDTLDFIKILVTTCRKLSLGEVDKQIFNRFSMRFRQINSQQKDIHSSVRKLINRFLRPKKEATLLDGSFLINSGIKRRVEKIFLTNELSQYSDDVNPISEIAHMRRIKYDVDKPSLGDRNFQDSMKHVICPVETPESGDIGITMNFSLDYNNKNNTGKVFGAPASLIPFILNNDANRCLMGSSMLKQALALSNPGTNLTMTSTYMDLYDTHWGVMRSKSEGTVKDIDAFGYIMEDGSRIKCPSHIRANFNSNSGFIKKKNIGDEIKIGEVIGESRNFKDGFYSTGRSLLVGYMPFLGKNFEDSLVVSQRLVDEEVLSAEKLESTTIKFDKKEIIFPTLAFVESNGFESSKALTKQKLKSLIGNYVPKGNNIISYFSKNLGIIDSFGNIASKSNVEYQTKHFNMNYGVTINNILLTYEIDEEEVVFDLEGDLPELPVFKITLITSKLQNIEIGDKLSGVHGNKGTISLILPEDKMPKLPDGTPIDVLINTLGIPSRMNIGQLNELWLGYISKNMRKLTIRDGNANLLRKSIKRIREDGIRSEELDNFESFIQDDARVLKSLEDNELPFVLDETFTISYDLLEDLAELFEVPINGVELTLANGLPTLEKVTVGYSTILRLKHTVDSKLKARNIVGHDTRSKRGGHHGQRSGEMEVWNIEAHNCENLLREMVTMTSDNNASVKSIYFNKIKGKENVLKKQSDGRTVSDFKELIKILGLTLDKVT